MPVWRILATIGLAAAWAMGCSADDGGPSASVMVVNPASSDASDANDGSELRPLKSIGRAAAIVQPGGTVLIQAGVYRESVVIERSGTAERPIQFVAAPGAEVVVTGTDVVAALQQEPAATGERVYSAPWPHRFIEWSRTGTHPDDDYHQLIGRAEQVFVDGYLLRQVLDRGKLERGSFYVDLAKRRLALQADSNADLSDGRHVVEASARGTIWEVKGDHVHTRGITFRYAANFASQGMVALRGRGDVLEDCVCEWSNACGLELRGEGQVVRRCTFENNGQEALAAAGAHGLLVTGSVIRQNNVKNFNREWEAGGLKIGLSRGVVLERSQFVDNRGHGIWFDLGNENCTVRGNHIARNEDAGIFYEISSGLHAHDNVIVGNGLVSRSGAWGASGGVSLSSSPGCVVERNLIFGNKEGLQFREQDRTTPRIGQKPGEAEEWIWNHDEAIQHNLFAYSRDAHVAGWFDVDDQRHLPAALARQSGPIPAARPQADVAAEFGAKAKSGRPALLSLEKLDLRIDDNLYFGSPAKGLWSWGVPWRQERRYQTLENVRDELGIQAGQMLEALPLANPRAGDYRLPASDPVFRLGGYPQGETPAVVLGALPQP